MKRLAWILMLSCPQVDSSDLSLYRVFPIEGRSSVTVVSSRRVSKKDLQSIARHFRLAYTAAFSFAAKEGLKQHVGIPRQLEILTSPKEVARASGKPERTKLGYAVARIDLGMRTIFLGRNLVEDLYVELGRWFFYPRNYTPGTSKKKDRALLSIAERFATHCLKVAHLSPKSRLLEEVE